MRVHWTTDYEGIANSFGFATHNDRARQALVSAGVTLDDTAPIAFHVTPPHRFEPIEGKKNIAYVAWEAQQLPELFRTTLAPADEILVPASFLVEPFEEMFRGKRIRVVPLGVDIDQFAYVERTRGGRRPNFRPKARGGRPFRFLWVGAPNARKGALHVLEAWKAFQDSEKCELYIKTSLPADSRAKQGVRREGNVIYDDRKVSLTDLVGIYHNAHCFVFPSTGEGWGLTFSEALATGLPAIYTPATSMTDIAPPELRLGYPVQFTLTDTDWSWKDADARGTPMAVHVKVPNADPNDIARLMAEVMLKPDEAFERGKAAAEYVRRNFTWERCGRTLRKIVRDTYQNLPTEELVPCLT